MNKAYNHNTPADAEIDLVAAQEDLATVINELIVLAPVDESDFSSHYNRTRVPRNLSLAGTGLLRETVIGQVEYHTTTGRAERTIQAAKILGRTVGKTTERYSYSQIDESSDGRFATRHHYIFTLGDVSSEGIDIDDILDTTMRVDGKVDFARQRKGIPSFRPDLIKIYRKADELFPDQPSLDSAYLSKPESVRSEVWNHARGEFITALYFMQRPRTNSTRGARMLARQDFAPEIDQMEDIAYYDAFKFASVQASKEDAMRERVGSTHSSGDNQQDSLTQ